MADAKAEVGSGSDAATSVYPALVPPLPQIVRSGGPVLSAPVFIQVNFSVDTLTTRNNQAAYLAAVAGSTYWTTTTGEYGVGSASIGTSVVETDPPPTMIDASQIMTWLVSRFDGTHKQWGSPSTQAIYVIFYPSGTTVTTCGLTSCSGFTATHDQSAPLPDGSRLAFAAIPDCPSFDASLTKFQSLTVATSHELIEAATDPYPEANPAYHGVAQGSVEWDDTGTNYGEVADLCDNHEYIDWLQPTDVGYMVQRTWSNAEAALGHDPCVPVATGTPYFGAVPQLGAQVTLTGTGTAHGVVIPVGSTATVAVHLFSDQLTTAWQVSALDLGSVGGDLTMTFDHTSGVNGDTLNLTIHVVKADPAYGSEPFAIQSTSSSRTTYFYGAVGN
jgi:hypothetical protein